MTFPESPVFSSWQDLYKKYHESFVDSPSEELWVFRGQRSKHWGLFTSLDRAFTRADLDKASWRHMEEGLVREFQRRISTVDHRIETPDSDNVLAWMALMQHHGTPTRLLDWTYSFFVALFFAIENAEEDAAVFAIDARWCNRKSRSLLPDSEASAHLIAGDPYVTSSATFRSLFARSAEQPLVYRVNSFQLNPRLAVQQGLFLCPGAIECGFEENLGVLMGDDGPCPVRKWIIPTSLHRPLLRELAYMNIGRHSLFPGLDGLAQSLAPYLLHGDRLMPPWRKKQGGLPFENWLDWKPWSS